MDNDQFKQQIASTFDDVSERYDENLFFSISAKKMADMVPCSGDMGVLDLSTGTGEVAIEVAKRYPQAKIEAVDLSPGMLEQAKSKARNAEVDNIVFRRCDVENLPHEDGVFDAITCGYAIFFYPDMELTYQSICKKLKPGGTFVFSSFTRDAFNPYAELFLHHLEKDYKIEAPGHLRERLKTEQQMEELSLLSNPKRIDIESHSIRYPITVNGWWSLLNNAGYKSLLDQLNSDQLTRFKLEHLEEVEATAVDGFIELNTDTLFGVVRL